MFFLETRNTFVKVKIILCQMYLLALPGKIKEALCIPVLNIYFSCVVSLESFLGE